MNAYDHDTALQDMLTSFILVGNINSFPKLHFLLCLHEQKTEGGTCQEFAKQFHVGDLSLMEEIIADLQAVGLLTRTGNRYQLSDDPYTKQYLQHLNAVFADPLARQKILDQVRHQSPLSLLARSVLDRYEANSPLHISENYYFAEMAFA